MPLYNPPAGGDHPDLATHDSLGLATDDELTTHAADTTSVHGIADTSALSLSTHDHNADYEASGAVATHAGAADPHAGYQKESEKGAASGYASLNASTKVPIAELPTGTSGTTVALGDAAAGLISTHEAAGDPHTGYLKENDANWIDLTDGGATTLHTHAGGSGAPTDADYLVGTANGTLSNEIVVGTTPGGELGGTWASPTVDATHSGSAHHAQSHVLTGADHTASGLTIGHVLTASSSTAFGFAAPAAPTLTSASAFATAETTISAATYADITGCSVSLAAGTWLVFGHVVARAVNAISQVFVAITHSDNTVISESAASRPASGTANLNSPFSASWFALVSPGSTTTYKLRGARGLTTHTASWIAMDGNGVNTTNHASNNTDKGTGIFAVRIA